MGKAFNITGICVPKKHYMVDITSKLEQIKLKIDKEEYFTINRGRQYGKTTTLLALEKYLRDEFIVISLSFEDFNDEEFENANNFCQAFLLKTHKALQFTSVSEAYRKKWLNPSAINFSSLSNHITELCRGKSLVLMIDEVDKVSNNRVFLGFLSKLREKFLARSAEKMKPSTALF